MKRFTLLVLVLTLVFAFVVVPQPKVEAQERLCQEQVYTVFGSGGEDVYQSGNYLIVHGQGFRIIDSTYGLFFNEYHARFEYGYFYRVEVCQGNLDYQFTNDQCLSQSVTDAWSTHEEWNWRDYERILEFSFIGPEGEWEFVSGHMVETGHGWADFEYTLTNSDTLCRVPIFVGAQYSVFGFHGYDTNHNPVFPAGVQISLAGTEYGCTLQPNGDFPQLNECWLASANGTHNLWYPGTNLLNFTINGHSFYIPWEVSSDFQFYLGPNYVTVVKQHWTQAPNDSAQIYIVNYH